MKDDDWNPAATHGDSEEKLRAAVEAHNQGALEDLRVQLCRERLPPEVVERMVEFARAQASKNLEESLPFMMAAMALGDAGSDRETMH